MPASGYYYGGGGRGASIAASPGADVFGSIPRPTPMPNPSADLAAIYPNLSGTNAAASSALLSELGGQLSPATLDAIRNASASYGINSGMPGSGLTLNRGVRDIGITSEQLQNQGLGNYSSLLPTVSRTQTVQPELQAEINAGNAVNAAAPNPTAAATYAQQLFDKYLKMTTTPAGGTGAYSSGGGQPWWQQGRTNWGSGGSGAEWDRFGGIPGII